MEFDSFDFISHWRIVYERTLPLSSRYRSRALEIWKLGYFYRFNSFRISSRRSLISWTAENSLSIFVSRLSIIVRILNISNCGSIVSSAMMRSFISVLPLSSWCRILGKLLVSWGYRCCFRHLRTLSMRLFDNNVAKKLKVNFWDVFKLDTKHKAVWAFRSVSVNRPDWFG